ncbi:MAG: EsaB/YukD family protein [Ktedonobacterales bacterium]
MTTVLLTVRGPEQSVDMELPGDMPIGELFPMLIALCAPHASTATIQVPAAALILRWRLRPFEGAAFEPNATLIDCGIMDGAFLRLEDVMSRPMEIPQQLQAPPFQSGVSVPATVATGGIGVRWNKDGLTS